MLWPCFHRSQSSAFCSDVNQTRDVTPPHPLRLKVLRRPVEPTGALLPSQRGQLPLNGKPAYLRLQLHRPRLSPVEDCLNQVRRQERQSKHVGDERPVEFLSRSEFADRSVFPRLQLMLPVECLDESSQQRVVDVRSRRCPRLCSRRGHDKFAATALSDRQWDGDGLSKVPSRLISRLLIRQPYPGSVVAEARR